MGVERVKVFRVVSERASREHRGCRNAVVSRCYFAVLVRRKFIGLAPQASDLVRDLQASLCVPLSDGLKLRANFMC